VDIPWVGSGMARSLLVLESLNQSLRRGLPPCGNQCAPYHALGRGGERYRRRALLAPAAVDGLKGFGLCADELGLLIGRELYHSTTLGVAERGEDLAGDAKVGMAHVRGLDRLRQAQRQISKFVGGHRVTRNSWFDENVTAHRTHFG